MSAAVDLALRSELELIEQRFFAACTEDEASLHQFMADWISLTDRIRDAVSKDLLSLETVQLAQNIASPIAEIASSLIVQETEAQNALPIIVTQTRTSLQNINPVDYVDDDDEEEADAAKDAVNWEGLRDWFLARLAYPIPTTAERTQLLRRYNISLHDFNLWLNRLKRSCGWSDAFQECARGNRVNMEQVVRHAIRELDHDLPKDQCRIPRRIRDIVARMRTVVREEYKDGPSGWWSTLDERFSSASSRSYDWEFSGDAGGDEFGFYYGEDGEDEEEPPTDDELDLRSVDGEDEEDVRKPVSADFSSPSCSEESLLATPSDTASITLPTSIPSKEAPQPIPQPSTPSPLSVPLPPSPSPVKNAKRKRDEVEDDEPIPAKRYVPCSCSLFRCFLITNLQNHTDHASPSR